MFWTELTDAEDVERMSESVACESYVGAADDRKSQRRSKVGSREGVRAESSDSSLHIPVTDSITHVNLWLK